MNRSLGYQNVRFESEADILLNTILHHTAGPRGDWVGLCIWMSIGKDIKLRSSSVSTSRRGFLKTAGFAKATLVGESALTGLLSTAAEADNLEAKKRAIRVAGYKFDRIAALADGRVQIDGCDSDFEEATFRLELILKKGLNQPFLIN